MLPARPRIRHGKVQGVPGSRPEKLTQAKI